MLERERLPVGERGRDDLLHAFTVVGMEPVDEISRHLSRRAGPDAINPAQLVRPPHLVPRRCPSPSSPGARAIALRAADPRALRSRAPALASIAPTTRPQTASTPMNPCRISRPSLSPAREETDARRACRGPRGSTTRPCRSRLRADRTGTTAQRTTGRQRNDTGRALRPAAEYDLRHDDQGARRGARPRPRAPRSIGTGGDRPTSNNSGAKSNAPTPSPSHHVSQTSRTSRGRADRAPRASASRWSRRSSAPPVRQAPLNSEHPPRLAAGPARRRPTA